MSGGAFVKPARPRGGGATVDGRAPSLTSTRIPLDVRARILGTLTVPHGAFTARTLREHLKRTGTRREVR